jgi:hypothetical protein
MAKGQIEFVRWIDPMTSPSLPDPDTTSIEELAQVEAFTDTHTEPAPVGYRGPLVLGVAGAIPLSADSLTGRLYSLWVGHTNFHVTRSFAEKVLRVPGVEVFRPMTPYRFLLGVARLFDRETVMEGVRAVAAGSGREES